MSGGELTTKPFTFRGDRLQLNFASSAAGDIRVEIQRPDGKPFEGFALDDCNEVFGDSVDRVVTWKNGPDVGALSGQAVRLRVALRDADLYAFQFGDE